ncbi:cyclic nucleotide-binding domain-containing protein [Treponema sp.]|uniref:cyclic nucleotide-binding domain-containing protein n=1 Tax=Treponema sp. TaxID=166 RepID=UPI003890D2EA
MLQLSFVNFKPNSHILLEGTPATDRFFIIQSGKARSYNENPVPGIKPEILGPGDFIGVIACMSGHSQTKNVVTIEPVTAIMVMKSQYSELISQNTPVALKIVKSFARDMRIVNDQLTKLTAKKNLVGSPEEIFPIAEYYEKQGLTDIACYGYYQYIKHNSNGINLDPAKARFTKLKPRSKAVYFEPTNEIMRTYPANTMIMTECQTGGDMFIIQDGSVRITKVVEGKEIILAILKKGDMFGEMALLENKPRSANAIAHTTCQLMVVNKTNFNQMVATQPQMISKLTTTFADRLWAMCRQLANTLLSDPREKLIDVVALQVEKLKTPPMKGEVYNTGISVADLMKMGGIPSDQQNAAYNMLMTDQNIKIVNSQVLVPNVPELIKQAAFYRKQSSKHANDR